MKLFLLFFTCFLITWSCPSVNAQENTVKIENIVNEQFGTLLESLLTNGKIDELSAKAYLETVFGYDESVSNYLQTLNLTQQIGNLQQGSLSFDAYIEMLGSNLFDLIPESYRQKLLSNPNYIGWQLGQELRNGHVSSTTLQNTISLISNNIKQNEENQKIISKLKLITPTYDKLKKSDNKKKLSILNDKTHIKNWKLNPEKIKPGFFSDESSYNQVLIDENGQVVLEPSQVNLDKFLNIYKNKERFDFSKDFKLILRGQIDPYEYNGIHYQFSNFSLLIGQYYQVDINLLYTKQYKDWINWSVFSIKAPIATFTPNYGVFNYENLLYFTKKENVKTVTTHLNKGYEKAGATENKSLNFSSGYEIIIQNINGVLTYSINGIDCGVIQKMNYLPNKYYFDIKSNDHKLIIESLLLEYL